MVVRLISPKASNKWLAQQFEQEKDSREWNQMMLAFFWSVADCNQHGCAVQCQWDALCKCPNHKKTHTKEKKKKGNRHRKHSVSMCLSLKRRSIQIKKYGDRSIETERKRERERERERERVSVYAAACAPLPCHPYPAALCEVLLVLAHTSAWQTSMKPSSCRHPLFYKEATKKCNMRWKFCEALTDDNKRTLSHSMVWMDCYSTTVLMKQPRQHQQSSSHNNTHTHARVHAQQLECFEMHACV